MQVLDRRQLTILTDLQQIHQDTTLIILHVLRKHLTVAECHRKTQEINEENK